MDGGAVERVLAVPDAQEADGLLAGFGADTGNLVELGTGADLSVLVAVSDDVERGAFGDASNVAEQGPVAEGCAGQEMKGGAEMCELSELCELSLLLH